MKTQIRMMLPAALVLLTATTLWAFVSPPVTVTLLGDPRPAVEGEIFEGVLEVTFEGDVEIRDVACEGESWSVVRLDAPSSFLGAKGDRFEIEFAAQPGDTDKPLLVTFDAAGYRFVKTLDLSERNYQRTLKADPVEPAPEGPVRTGSRPRGEYGPEAVAMEGEQADPDGKATIRIHGRFGYVREDAVWVGAHSLRVYVYDEDTGDDDLLGSSFTDSYGYYDFTVEGSNAGAGDTPDIYVIYETFNYKIELKDPTYGNLYRWTTGTTWNYTGTDLDYGWLQPGNEDGHPAVHLHTTTTRVFNYCYFDAGYNPDSIDVLWPDGTEGAWYDYTSIHMSSGLQWQEQVPAHEYGHYWDDTYSGIEPFDYCNGWCDNPPDCGHCIWCEESPVIAWMEGWANFFSDASTHTFLDRYGLEPMYQMEFEALQPCGGYGFHDPELTEGFLAALLRDIQDDDNENEPQYPDWSDMTTLGSEEIFLVADADNPDGPYSFMDSFIAAYPALKEWVWQTSANNGYDPDYASPGVVTGLTSTSHSTSGDSPDPTIDFVWTRASDDVSGTYGYGLYIASGAYMPSTTMDIGNVTSYTTPILSPGTYYFNIRAVDRSGRWSSSFASYGPITIREAEPADLTYYEHANWDYVIVPSNTTGATVSEAHVSATLPGASTGTYWSIYGRNIGDDATSTGFHGSQYNDGEAQAGVSWGPISGGGLFAGTNMGPLYFRGGRHTMSFFYDDFNAISEADETNNLWGHQFIWSPWSLTTDSYYHIGAPGVVDGGWDHVVDGSILWYNCDGTRTSSSAWWNGVIVWADDDLEDYDVRLHNPSTGSENGFGASLAASYRSPGQLDGIIINRNQVGNNTYDVGALNRFGGGDGYHIEHVTHATLSFGDSITVPVSMNQMLKLHETYVSVDDTGYVSVVVDVDPADGPLTLLWFDKTHEIGTLSSYDAMDVTDPTTGRARLDLHISEAGFNGFSVYRNPVDGRGAMEYVIEVQTTPPDFICYEAAGWHSPLVPRPADDGTPASVALPDTLYGNIASTYMNLATHNDSPTGSASLYARFYIDDAFAAGLSWGSLPGFATSLFNWDYALTVKGGRHTFSVRHDPFGDIEEIHEDNNNYGEQYIWGPLSIPGGTSVARSVPPEMMGGWDDIPSGPGVWFNCDGLRLDFDGWWMVMAVMPASGTDDIAIRVHEPAVGAKDGFGYNYAISDWGPGQSDFILVNYNNLTDQPYDFGVLRYSSTGGYVANASASTYLGNPVYGSTYGPYAMGSSSIINLHEFNLAPGFYVIRVQNEVGSVDWGASIYGPDSELVTKSESMSGGAAWYNGPGGNESIGFQVVTGGYHCLAVWKTSSTDLYTSGAYSLHVWDGMTEIEDELPVQRVTRLDAVHPNPFNPRTTIAYQLATDTPVELRIYDVQGSLVRTLVDGTLPAGPHEAVWDGTDDHGQRVASDVYLVRLRAGATDEMAKLVLLK